MLSYIFRKLFGIVKEKNIIISPEKEIIEIKINKFPDIIYLKDKNKYYRIIKITSEIINSTLVYNWISVEEI